MYECQEVSNTALHNFPWPQTLKKKLEMRTRIKEKSFTPAGFEPKNSRIDHRHSTNWATRPSWEQVSIRWPMSGQTLNCVWWCNRRSIWWCVESGSSCHRRNEGRENHGGLMHLGLFLFQMNLEDVFIYYGFKATKMIHSSTLKFKINILFKHASCSCFWVFAWSPY